MVYLGSERHKLGVVLLIVVVQRLHVLGVGDKPVDGREMFTLSKLLVQAPEHLQSQMTNSETEAKTILEGRKTYE